MDTADNAIKDADISVLIVAKPDRSRHSLKFLLEIKPEIKVVGQASESILALKLVRQHRPALMILTKLRLKPPRRLRQRQRLFELTS